MTISFRALEIPASELAEKPLGQPSADHTWRSDLCN